MIKNGSINKLQINLQVILGLFASLALAGSIIFPASAHPTGSTLNFQASAISDTEIELS